MPRMKNSAAPPASPSSSAVSVIDGVRKPRAVRLQRGHPESGVALNHQPEHGNAGARRP